MTNRKNDTRRRCILIVLAAGALGSPLAAQAPTHTELAIQVDAANKAFEQGLAMKSQNPAESHQRLIDAAAGYEAVINAGVSNGRLHYNLANTYVLLGDLGRAIANYRRAERLIPGDSNLLANLSYARTLCRTRIEMEAGRAAVNTLFFWHHKTSQTARFRVGLGAYLLFWVLLLVRLWAPKFKWRLAGLPLAVLWLTLGASVTVGEVHRRTQREAVLMSDDVTLRKGDGENYDPQFREPIHTGVEVTILEERNQWSRVRLNDGKEGWLPSRDLEVI